MIRGLLSLFLLLTLTSCATWRVADPQQIDVQSPIAGAKFKFRDSIYSLPTVIHLPRSKEDVPIELHVDTLVKHYTLRPSINAGFLFGNLGFLHAAPIAYIVDLNSPKRFYYEGRLSLHPTDTSAIIRTRLANRGRSFVNYFSRSSVTKTGDFKLMSSSPYINNFEWTTNDGKRSRTGFFGITAGAEYFYRDDRFLAISFGALTDGHIFPMTDYFDDYEELLSELITITDNKKVNRFSFGYGFSYVKNTRKVFKRDHGFSLPEKTLTDRRHNLGFAFNSYFEFSRFFFIGLRYQPQILTIAPEIHLDYQHSVSLDFLFKFTIRKNFLARRK